MNHRIINLLALVFISISAFSQSVVWTEDFEGTWTDNWYVESSTWEVGEPTSGPGYTVEGTQCAATVLAGNYSDNVTARLIRYIPFTVPAAESNPRLRFWHWFSFNTLDRGRIQIRVSGGAWQNVSSYEYTGYCAGVWTYEELDLSSWAGENVEICLYFNSATYGGTTDVSSGWYVDDMKLITGPFLGDINESFEFGYGDWSVNRGTWEIGEPTSGPGSAHTGTQCAGTKLNGNFSDYVDTRLRSTWFTVPAVGENPRLRMWHWFSFSTSDYGRVQVRTNGGSWQNLTTHSYAGYCGGVWTVEEIDLSSWADSTVQIAFFLHTESYGGTTDVSSGWYIDDLELRTGPYSMSSFIDFESGYGDWSVDRGTWEIGEPSSGPGSAYSGTSCAGTVLDGNFSDYVDTRLRSTWFNIPAESNNPRLRFWHWFSFSTLDYGRVQIRTRNTNWQDLGSYNYYNYGCGVWTIEEIDLKAWADSTVQIAFFLHTASYGGTVDVSSGWYIDDMELKTGPTSIESFIGFEEGYGDWTVQRGTWQIGTPTAGPTAAHSGENCAGTRLNGNYCDYVDTRLRSTWFTVPSVDFNPSLKFWHWYCFSTLDNGTVQIQTKNSGWIDISPAFSGCVPSASSWAFYYIDLSAWADSTVRIGFDLHTATYGGTTDVSTGWYIDDIVITNLGASSCDESTVVTGLTAVPAESGTGVTLDWDPIPEADFYQVKGRKLGSIPYGNFITMNNHKNVGGLLTGTCYEWKVRARCAVDLVVTAWSPMDTFCTPNPKLGNTLAESMEELLIYPNPMTDFTTVVLNSSGTESRMINLIDLSGKLIRQYPISENGRIRIEREDLSPGVYMLVMEGKPELSRKLVVQ